MLISTTTHLSLPEEAPVNLFQDIKQKKRNTHTHTQKKRVDVSRSVPSETRAHGNQPQLPSATKSL